jgi:hypothetical protein
MRQLREKYSEIVIDVGGRDTGSLRAALTVSDAILIPFQPRSVDLWAGAQIAALVAPRRAKSTMGCVPIPSSTWLMPKAAPKGDSASFLVGDDPVSVVFDLVQPAQAGWWLANEERLTRENETSRLGAP